MKFWILDEQRRPKVTTDINEWGSWRESASDPCRVGDDDVCGYCVSTVFLGIDHSFGRGPPILWETMVFGEGHLDMDMDRCGGTWEQAEEMHRRMVARVRASLGVDVKEEANNDDSA